MDNLETVLGLGSLIGAVLFTILLIVFQEKRIFARICALLLFVCGLCFICVANTTGAKTILNVIDIPSAVTIFVIVLPALIMTGHGKDFSKGVKIVSKDQEASLGEMKKASAAFSFAGKASIAAAVISMFISIIGMLVNLEDKSALGPLLAVCIISPFYATIAYLAFATLKANIDRRIIDLTDK